MNNKHEWVIIVLLGLAVLTNGLQSAQQVGPSGYYLERGIGVRDSVTLGESKQVVDMLKFDSLNWAFDWKPEKNDSTVRMIKYEGREIPTEKLVKVGMPENTVRRRYGSPQFREQPADSIDLLFYHGIVFKTVNDTVVAIIIIPIEKARR